MRKVYYLIIAVILAALVGCQAEIEQPDVQSPAIETFYATFENDTETRTALDATNNVIWSEDDQINIFLEAQ